MKLRGLGKLRTRALVLFVLAVNVLCLLSMLAMQGVTWRAGSVIQSYSTMTTRMSQRIASMSTPKPTVNLSLSPAVREKVDSMHEALNLSRSSMNTVYPAQRIGRYLLLYPQLCSDADTVHIIIIVHTAPKNLERRQRIRETFAKRSLFTPFNVRVAFLLGKTLNSTLERVLWMEHARYNDTVMGDFVDDYHNLTLKGVMGYRWVSQYCSNAEIVLKIDDDVIVNMYKLLYSFMGHMRGKQKSIFCNHWIKDTMPILRTGKWKVEDRVFPNMTRFPYDYCSGFIVLISADLMGPLHDAAMKTPFFWIDDLYLFGMLPKVVGGVNFYNYALDKNIALNDKKAFNCTIEKGAACPMFGSVIRDGNYWRYWDMLTGIFGTPKLSIVPKLIS